MSDYPKMVYKGVHYEDAMAMNAAVLSGAVVSMLVFDKDEEALAIEDGFGPLGDLIEPVPVVVIPQEESKAPSEPEPAGE